MHNKQMKGRQNKASYGIVLLAAGMSSRLGRPKQLLAYQGDYLVNHAIKATEQVKDAVTVVIIGAEAETLLNEIKNVGVKVVLNQQFKEGMSSSIRCGVQYIQDYDRNIENIIIMVCDQPFVTAEYLHTLMERHAHTGAPMVASRYASSHGVPALFHKALFQSMGEINDHHGAKKIIEANLPIAEIVDFQEGAYDIDTPDDMSRLF